MTKVQEHSCHPREEHLIAVCGRGRESPHLYPSQMLGFSFWRGRYIEILLSGHQTQLSTGWLPEDGVKLWNNSLGINYEMMSMF